MSEAANDKLRAAREATPSRWFPGRAMTRTELADLVVAHVWRHEGIESPFDRKYLAKLETGRIRFPSARYRRALRAILGAASDDDLGFVSSNRSRVAKALPDPHRQEDDDGPSRRAEEVTALVDDRELDARTAPLIHRMVSGAGPAPGDRPGPPPHIGRELLALVADRTRELERLDGLVTGDTANADDAEAVEAVAVELLDTLAELCLLAGWRAAAGGRRGEADRYWHAGMAAARATGDEVLAGQLFSLLLCLDAGPPLRRDLARMAAAAYRRIVHRTTSPRRSLCRGMAWVTIRLDEDAPGGVGQADDEPCGPHDDAWYADRLAVADLHAPGAARAVADAAAVLARVRAGAHAAAYRPDAAAHLLARVRWSESVAVRDLLMDDGLFDRPPF